jgi:uncharacterized protein
MNLLKYVFITLSIVFALFLIKAFDITYPISVVSSNKATELSVVGEGKVEVTPDVAYVDSGITVNNVKTVEEAQNQINQVNNKIVTAMQQLGVQKADIKTSNYSINPNYVYEGSESKITGYNGNVTISIKAKNVQLLSRIIEEATKAGANQIQGTRFEVDNPDKYREQARDIAIANAKEQAKRLATTLGVKLGKIVAFEESTPGSVNQPVFALDRAKGLGGGVGADMQPGSQTVSSVVKVWFEKK